MTEGEDPEVINCADNNEEESEENYEHGQFTCQWEIGRYLKGPNAPQEPICGAFFESRSEFVEHTRVHVDK